MMRKIVTLFLVLCALPAFSTHIIGGYIQVRNVASSTYEITVRLYLGRSGASNQETALPVCFDDGLEPAMAPLRNSQVLEDGILLNEYRTTHAYNGSGSGRHTVFVSITNRTDSRNFPSALSTPFYIKTTFTTAQPNSTPVFEDFRKRLTGLVNQKNEYNFLAKDPEGDSVVHSVIRVQKGRCGQGSQLASDYRFPNDVTRKGTFKIGLADGQLVWNAPTETGTYSFAVQAREWRNGQLIGETVFDLLTLVTDATGHSPGTLPPYEPVVEGGPLTGVENRIDDQEVTITVLPSPSSSRFEVVLKSRKPTTAAFQLLDAQGRLLEEVSTKTSALEIRQPIGREQLAPGLYVIRTSVRGRSYTSKVIKK